MARLLPLLAAACLAATAAGAAPRTDILRGTLTGADHQTYREIPFDVPAGTRSITVEFSYNRANRTTVDLGLRGPEGFRGWSGGNKARFTVADSWATPSYIPGPITPGRWHLILGLPNVRQGTSASYEARITLDGPDIVQDAPLASGPGWYRGDFHAHTGHSDGTCETGKGDRAPCPLDLTVDAAARRGLHFVAITEHNTTSHHAEMAALQPFHPGLLLIPGREITTFHGHANIFGPTRFVDFQLGSRYAPNWNRIAAQVRAANGIISINHPAAPSGEDCMGCGWTVPDTDWSQVAAIEVVNGGGVRATKAVESPISGIPFWEALLSRGHRLTAIAGSDNHDARLPPATPSAIGTPTTVVHARELSVPALLDGVCAARVYIDVEGTGRALDWGVVGNGRRTEMGGTLRPRTGASLTLELAVTGVPGGRAELVDNGRVTPFALPAAGPLRIPYRADGRRHWLRANVRDADGKLVLIGNPIWLEPAR